MKKFILAKQSGFSLLEVIMTLGLLLFITIAVSSLLGGSFDLRRGLSETDMASHRMSLAMDTVVRDLEQIFFIPTANLDLNPDGSKGGLFEIERDSESSKLKLSTLVSSAFSVGVQGSDLKEVEYFLTEDPKISGMTHLVRHAASFGKSSKDNSLDEPKPFVKYIKRFTLRFWDGEKWSEENWNTASGSSRDKLPKRVRVIIETYDGDTESLENGDSFSKDEMTSSTLMCDVYIPGSQSFKELKQASKNVTWDRYEVESL